MEFVNIIPRKPGRAGEKNNGKSTKDSWIPAFAGMTDWRIPDPVRHDGLEVAEQGWRPVRRTGPTWRWLVNVLLTVWIPANRLREWRPLCFVVLCASAWLYWEALVVRVDAERGKHNHHIAPLSTPPYMSPFPRPFGGLGEGLEI